MFYAYKFNSQKIPQQTAWDILGRVPVQEEKKISTVQTICSMTSVVETHADASSNY